MTKVMEINMVSNMKIKVNNKELEKVKFIKYLGSISDKGLKFTESIEDILREWEYMVILRK